MLIVGDFNAIIAFRDIAPSESNKGTNISFTLDVNHNGPLLSACHLWYQIAMF